MVLCILRNLTRHCVLAFVSLTISLSFPAKAQEFCSDPLPLAQGVEPALGKLSPFGEVIAIPGLNKPMINIGAKTVLTIEEGLLVPFDGPPLDHWNRLLPVLVRWPDGEVWAYSKVRPGLYRFDAEEGAFVPVTLDEGFNVRSFAASGTLRRHEDRRQDRRHDGYPPLYAYTGEKLDGLVEIARDGFKPVLLPKSWQPGGWVPINVENIGTFLPAGNEIWFRRDDDAAWHRIAHVTNVRSLYSQSPFSMFQVQRSEKGGLWVMLEDRVLVGQLDDHQDWPVLEYQLAGDIIIHQPTRQVLVFPNAPLSRSRFDRPRSVSTEDALYKVLATGPEIVPGYRAAQQRSGTVPFNSWIYHASSGLTLIAHADGIAGFDGETLRNLPELAYDSGVKRVLRKIGDRYLIEIMGGGYAEITDDLALRPIKLPEQGGLRGLGYSSVLERFVLHSTTWKRVYTSKDLVHFYPVSGDYESIRAVVGDLPSKGSLFVNSASSGYLIRRCAE